MQHDLPTPADDRKQEEQQHQRRHRVFAGEQRRFVILVLILQQRAEPNRIGEPLLAAAHVAQAVFAILNLFARDVLRVDEQRHAETFAEKAGHPVAVYARGKLFRRSAQIVVGAAQRLCAGLFKQIGVAQRLRLALRLDLRAHGGVKLAPRGAQVCAGIKQAAQAERRKAQKVPRHEGKLQQEALPLVAVHHLSGQRDRVPALHGRVLRQNEAAEIIRKRLDCAADDRQPPKPPLDGHAQQRQRRAPPAARAVQIERAIRRHFLVDAHLHKQAAQDHDERVGNQHPIRHRNQTAHHNAEGLPELARSGQRHDGVVHNVLKGTVRNLVDGYRKHAPAVRRRARPPEGREEVRNHVPFLPGKMQAFQRAGEFRAQKRRDQTDHNRHPVMAEHGLARRALPIPARAAAKGGINPLFLLLFLPLLHTHRSPIRIQKPLYHKKAIAQLFSADIRAYKGAYKKRTARKGTILPDFVFAQGVIPPPATAQSYSTY